MRNPAYDPGELDQQITIRRPVLVSDGMGGQDVTFEDVVVGEWAKVRPLRGDEVQRHDRLKAVSMVRFVIRFRPDIRHDDIIIWQNDAHNIRYIPPASEREMYLPIDAERGGPV